MGYAVYQFRHHAGRRKSPDRWIYEYSQESAICRPVAKALTDETAQDMVRAYQQILAENPEFDGALADFSFLQGTLVSFLWPEVEDQTQTYPTLTIYYVDPARLTGLYERREEKLEYYLENQFSDPADRQFFLDMDSQVDKPMAYDWAAGWSAGLGNGIGGFGQMVLPVVLALALTSVFAGERRRGMDTLQVTIPAWKSGTGRGKAPVWPCPVRWESLRVFAAVMGGGSGDLAGIWRLESAHPADQDVDHRTDEYAPGGML